MSFQNQFVVALAGTVLLSSSAFAGPEWIEQGDAGGKVSTAQRTFGTQLNAVSGSLTGMNLLGVGDFEDMFFITITDPANFSMQVTNANFDAQLWLFNLTVPGEAFGLLANDNTPSGQNPFVGNAATDSTGAHVNLPGVYLIAVSGAGRYPVSANGAMFFFGSPTEVSGADGPGGLLPHLDWAGEGQTGDYLITLTGAAPSDLPAPGAIALLALAAGFARPRRQR